MDKQTCLHGWRSRMEAAMLAAWGQKVERFATSLQGKDEETRTYHDHTGEPVEIAGLYVEPCKGFDEEALPYFKGRFDDGVELQVGAEELFTRNPVLRELIAAVCSGFAVARDMGYVGPYHLAGEGSDEEILRFMREVATFEPDWTWESFNTPADFRQARGISASM